MIVGRQPDPDWLDEVIARLRLRDLLDRRPVELSGGEQQRVLPRERWPADRRSSSPTSPPEISTRGSGRELLDILRLAVDDLEQTVILVTHDLTAACVGDRVVMLADGKVAAPWTHRRGRRCSALELPG